MDRRAVFFVTPGAGSGRARERLSHVLSMVNGLRVRSVVARSFAEAGDHVEKLAADEIPVAAGGDGTVNLLARALRAAGKADRGLVMLPLGTGNAFGYRFGHDTVPGALLAIQGGTPLAIDVMTTTHPDYPLALMSISAGFESKMLAAVPRGFWGFGLVPALLRVGVRSWRGIEVTLDGELLIDPAERVYNAGLYNLPYYGFGHLMWPDAEPADGVAEAVVCRSGRAYWRVLRRGLRTGAQQTGTGDPRWRRWHRARFRASHGVQIDGEVAAGGDFEVQVEPRGLTVLTRPRGAESQAPYQ